MIRRLGYPVLLVLACPLLAGGQVVSTATPEAAGVQLRLETRLEPSTVRLPGTAVLTLELRYRRDAGEIGAQLEQPESKLDGVEEARRWTRTGSYREGEATWSVREFCVELRPLRAGTVEIPAFPVTYLDLGGPSKVYSDPRQLTVLPAPLPRRAPWGWIVGGVLAAGFAFVAVLLVRARRLAETAGEADSGQAAAEAEELRRIRQMRLAGENNGFFSAAEKLADQHLARVTGGRPGRRDLSALDSRAREAAERLYAACGEAKYNPSARGRDRLETVEKTLETLLAVPAAAGDHGKRKSGSKENAI